MTDPVVVGVDSSTQSCKVVVRSLATGAVVRSAAAPHPPGTEVDPAAWEVALRGALDDADGLGRDVVALGIAAQQHGMVVLDDAGEVVRPALLWNDTRSAGAAADLVGELGREAWADAIGSVPVASFTVTKLRWLATHEPALARRVAAVCLPHDWLTWRLRGAPALDALVTDRGDASGTGYWSPTSSAYRDDLLTRAFGQVPTVPRVAAPWEVIGTVRAVGGGDVAVSAGTGDNMGAALGLGAAPGDVVVSIGTSGVVAAVAEAPTADASGLVAGFADATGRHLPLACTLNGAPALGAVARILGCDLDRLSDLALSAAPGAEGVVLVPYFEGERTPNRPDAHASLVGLTLANATPVNLARAAVEGLLCGLADGLDALVDQGVEVRRILLVGGGARSPAVRHVAATVFEGEVRVPPPGEDVALGAAVQAATAWSGGVAPPWPVRTGPVAPGSPIAVVRSQYADATS